MKQGTLVALFLPLLLAAQQPPPKASIAGHVTNAATGELLKKATVILEPGAPNLKRQMAISNADGSFEFTSIDPGLYGISGNHTGFLTAYYGAKKPNRRGDIISVAAGQQVTDLTLALTPQAVISGRVVDEDGDPIQGATVELLMQTWQNGKLSYAQRNGDAQSDDRGDFRLAALEPGKYLLSAQIQHSIFEPSNDTEPKIRPVTTYYSGSTSVENATPVEIQTGQELSIVMRMLSAQTFHVRGKIAGTLPQGIELRSLQVALLFEKSQFLSAGISRIAKGGAFDIASVAPGFLPPDGVQFRRKGDDPCFSNRQRGRS